MEAPPIITLKHGSAVWIFLVCVSTALLSAQGSAFAQSAPKAYTSMSLFYIDNADGNYEVLNVDLLEELKNKLDEAGVRHDNYFFAYTCNGENGRYTSDPVEFAETGLKKYLQKGSISADYVAEKKMFRDHFTEDYPVRIKQALEINFFLSSNAVKQMMDDASDLPTPLVFPRELVLYLNNSDLKVRLNYYLNNEIRVKMGEDKIRQTIYFCHTELGMQNANINIVFK